MKKSMKKIIPGVVLLAALAGCASYDLSVYEFVDRPMAIDVRVIPGAEVESNYFVTVDPNDPVSTILSIGSSVAKANEVARAQERMDTAMRRADVEFIVKDELEEFVAFSLGSEIVSRRPEAEYYLLVEIDAYGIDAESRGGAIDFALDGRATLYSEWENQRIWTRWLHVREPIRPGFFGIPGAAGNVVTAAHLSELTVEEIVVGLEAIAREAAHDIAEDIEASTYRY
jgi:hypothetical protein